MHAREYTFESGPPRTLADDEIALVWATLEAAPARLEELRGWLTPGELEVASRYHFERDRRRSVVSRGTLRELVGALLGRSPKALLLEAGAHGKPALRDAALELNVSHTEEHLVVALARRGALGVDVEAGHAMLDVEEIAPAVFTPRERAALASYVGPAKRQAFLRGWTRKEAYLKARSVGLSLPLADFEVSLAADEDGGLRSDVDPAEAARFVLVGVPAPIGCAAALAYAHRGASPPRLRIASLAGAAEVR